MKIKLKKHLIALTLGISAIPFSFYELEGPFKKEINLLSGIWRNIKILSSKKFSCFNGYSFLFIYNPQTGYKISYNLPSDSLYVTNIINFFLGEDDLSTSNIENRVFHFFKDKPNRNFNDFIEPLIIAVSDYSNQPSSSLSIKNTIQLNSTYIDPLGSIKIKNKNNNVCIYTGNKQILFEKVLKNWFIDGTELESIRDTVIRLKDKPEESVLKNDKAAKNSYELQRIAEKFTRSITLDEKATTLLKNSRILAVYGVFKGDEGKNSIVWGLAEDTMDPNKRRFHWITDLKDDIAKLIPNNDIE